METPATPCNIHDEVEQQDIIGFDAGFDTDEDTDEKTDPLTDSDPLDEGSMQSAPLSTTSLSKHHGNLVTRKLTYLTAVLT